MSFGVFLDRDGTIVVDRHFISDPDELVLLPHAAAGLRELRALGARLAIVTNQSGVARGLFTADAVERVNARLSDLLAAEGVELDGIFWCPHGPDDGCDCRKPQPGLLLRAARVLDVDIAQSFMIGDRPSDVEAGRLAGATPIALDASAVDEELHAANLVDAARLIAKRVAGAQRD